MLEIQVIQKPLNNHIEFEWKFKFLMKLMKVHVGVVAIFPCGGGHQTNFDICTMLSLMSISLSFGKLMKLHENLVKIRLIWWLLDGFCSLICEFGVKCRFLLKIYVIT
jgi:hypothetical protein